MPDNCAVWSATITAINSVVVSSERSQAVLQANKFRSRSGDCANISRVQQTRNIIREQQTIRDMTFICFRILSETASSSAHFQCHHRSDVLTKAVPHCSVSNPAQTNAIAGLVASHIG